MVSFYNFRYYNHFHQVHLSHSRNSVVKTAFNLSQQKFLLAPFSASPQRFDAQQLVHLRKCQWKHLFKRWTLLWKLLIPRRQERDEKSGVDIKTETSWTFAQFWGWIKWLTFKMERSKSDMKKWDRNYSIGCCSFSIATCLCLRSCDLAYTTSNIAPN